MLAELEREGKERKFKAPVSMKLQRGQVASFLAEHQEALGEGLLVLDEPLRDRRIFKELDRIEISAAGLRGGARPELVLAGGRVRLRQRHAVSLADILRAEGEGLPYLETPGGWIDLNAPAFRRSRGAALRRGPREAASVCRRASCSASRPPPGPAGAGAGRGERRDAWRASSSCRPAEPFRGRRPGSRDDAPRPISRSASTGCASSVENRLGGLLCDDMGLGKTLQVHGPDGRPARTRRGDRSPSWWPARPACSATGATRSSATRRA